MRIIPVILCGGAGARLWPASRPGRPKQFLDLVDGGASLFQATVERLRGLGAPPVVVAGERHLAEIERQLAAIGVEATVLVEPEARDSAPAIAAAAWLIAERDPGALAMMVASDHHIPDAEAFCAAVRAAAPAAADGEIVTFGVAPTAPETAYGYIEAGAALDGRSPVQRLARFVEKPDVETARRYLADGYLWNSGNFLFAAGALQAAFERHAPAVAAAAGAAVAEAARDGAVVRLSPSFSRAPKISFDYAVMEKTDRAAVIPVEFAWSDLGAWDAVWLASRRDGAGNALRGDAQAVGCEETLLSAAPGAPLVVGVGLNRVAVIAEADAVLVCGLDSAQAVKAAVEALKAEGRPEVDVAGAPSPNWEQWLFTAALPLWWTLGGDHRRGGFHEALDHQGGAVLGPRRARVQARQVFAYARAGGTGWAGPWRAAVDHGLEFFLERYRRPDGLFRTLVGDDGGLLDDTAMLYDQAFALLALAAAAQALPEQRAALSEVAEAVVGALASRAAAGGGFTEAAGPSPFQANPHMHLFESALAWEAAGGGPTWRALADEIAELALSRFINPDGGALHEFFDPSWRVVDGDAGDLVEPGHQFEWAWLLERWGVARGREDARAAARRLFEVGERGVDPRTGVAVNALHRDLSLQDGSARLWPQTERIKAAVLLGAAETDPARRARYARARAGAEAALWRYLNVPVRGSWRDKLTQTGFLDEPAPASSFYHIVGAIEQLRTIATDATVKP